MPGLIRDHLVCTQNFPKNKHLLKIITDFYNVSGAMVKGKIYICYLSVEKQKY